MPLVSIIVLRAELEAGDTSSVLHILKSCLSPPGRALSLFESVDIAFHGYDDDNRELFEIPDVREFVHLMDSEFPYWLFFLSKRGLGLKCLMLSFMPPFLTDEARKSVVPQYLEQLLSQRWFPAMNQICEMVGFSDQQIEGLSNRVAEYFIDGPLQAGDVDSRRAPR